MCLVSGNESKSRGLRLLTVVGVGRLRGARGVLEKKTRGNECVSLTPVWHLALALAWRLAGRMGLGLAWTWGWHEPGQAGDQDQDQCQGPRDRE